MPIRTVRPAFAVMRMPFGVMVALVALASVSPAFAADTHASARELLKSGAAAYDAGKLDEALALYDAALEIEPGNPTIQYEKALALQALGRFGECAAIAEPLAKLQGADRANYLVLRASCTDSAGDHAKAAEFFDAALSEFPDEPNLLFNAGITRIATNEPAKAKEILKRSVAARPTHPSSHLYLALALEQSGSTSPAILAYVRFLTLAPRDPRAARAAHAVGRLLGLGVKETGPNETTLQIDANAPKEEGNWDVVDLARLMAAAANRTEERRNLPDVENYRAILDAMLGVLVEEKGAGADFARKTYLPVVRDLRGEGLVEVFCYRALLPLAPPMVKPWLDAHPEKTKALDAFVAAHGGTP